MTEAEWLEATDPAPMLVFLRGGDDWEEDTVSQRKLRLFGTACCRSLPNEVLTPRLVIECNLLEAVVSQSDGTSLLKIAGDASSYDCEDAIDISVSVSARANNGYGNLSAQSQVLHDIFGDPFRPVAIDPTWRTSTVLALAEGIYAERAFDRMPVLADALQDAGCDNDDVLNHCRGDGPHVKGCWVVDLLLGKT